MPVLCHVLCLYLVVAAGRFVRLTSVSVDETSKPLSDRASCCQSVPGSVGLVTAIGDKYSSFLFVSFSPE